MHLAHGSRARVDKIIAKALADGPGLGCGYFEDPRLGETVRRACCACGSLCVCVCVFVFGFGSGFGFGIVFVFVLQFVSVFVFVCVCVCTHACGEVVGGSG